MQYNPKHPFIQVGVAIFIFYVFIFIWSTSIPFSCNKKKKLKKKISMPSDLLVWKTFRAIIYSREVVMYLKFKI